MVDALHGTLSLAAVTLVAGHVVTSVLDPFAPLRLTDAVIPFAGALPPAVGRARRAGVRPPARRTGHEPGAAANRRPRVAGRALGGVRLLAARARAHARNRQRRAPGWMLVLSLECVGLVAIAVGARIATSAVPARPRRRAGSDGVRRRGARVVATARATGQRLGAPRGHASSAAAAGRGRRRGPCLPRAAAPRLPIPFNTRARGTLTSGVNRDGTALVDIALRLRSPAAAILDVRLAGQPAGRRRDPGRPQPDHARSARRSGPLHRAAGRRSTAQSSSPGCGRARGRAMRVNVVLDLGRDVAQGPVSATVRATRETAP